MTRLSSFDHDESTDDVLQKWFLVKIAASANLIEPIIKYGELSVSEENKFMSERVSEDNLWSLEDDIWSCNNKMLTWGLCN